LNIAETSPLCCKQEINVNVNWSYQFPFTNKLYIYIYMYIYICRVSCPKIQESQFFTSTNTQKKYRIKQKLNCDSDYVVYLATCRKCQGQYVGKSQTIFKKRHSNHKSEIKKNTGGLGHHYNEGRGGCGYENFTVILIEQVEVKTPKFLAEREVYWQHQLRVFIENGCRAHCYRKDV
jgi:hypothetical protein